MSDAEKRKFVTELYPGRGWRRTVERMSGKQVFAIWKKEMAKLEEQAKQDKIDKPDDTDEIPF
jgi:hypothetical protein